MKIYLLRCLIASVTICLCGPAQMYSYCVVNNVQKVAKDWFLSIPNNTLADFISEWRLVVCSVWIGSLLSTLFSSYITNKFGRKWAMVMACILYLVGCCFISFLCKANNFTSLIIGRFFSGMAFGLSMLTAMLWIGELCPLEYRGFFTSFISILFGLGELAGTLVPTPELLGRDNIWFVVLLLGNAVAIILLPVVLYLPESPRFLFFRNGPSNETIKSIEFYHGSDSLHKILEELDMEESGKISQLSIRHMINDERFRNSLILNILLLGGIQLSGVSCVMQFSTQISVHAGLSYGFAAWGTVLVGVMRLTTSFGLPWLLKHFNRKPMIQISLYVTAFCDLGIAIFLACLPQTTFAGSSAVFLMVIFMMTNDVMYAANVTAAVELCTQEIRAVCVVCGRLVNVLIGLVLSFVFLSFGTIGEWSVMAFCGISSILISIYFYIKLPETRTNTFHQTAEQLAINLPEEKQPLLCDTWTRSYDDPQCSNATLFIEEKEM